MATRTEAQSPKREPSHSGRLLLRMPTTLHAELAARSEADGLSLNQYIVGALTRAVAGAAGSQGSQGSQGRTGLPRSVRIALVVNALVVALAAGTAIALLVHGWR